MDRNTRALLETMKRHLAHMSGEELKGFAYAARVLIEEEEFKQKEMENRKKVDALVARGQKALCHVAMNACDNLFLGNIEAVVITMEKAAQMDSVPTQFDDEFPEDSALDPFHRDND